MAMTMIREDENKVQYTFDKQDEAGFHSLLYVLYSECCVLRLARHFDLTIDEAISMFLSNDSQKVAALVEKVGMRWVD